MENDEKKYEWSTIVPEYISRLQSFAAQQLLESERLCVWWLLVDADNKQSEVHLKPCYYHKDNVKTLKMKKESPTAVGKPLAFVGHVSTDRIWDSSLT